MEAAARHAVRTEELGAHAAAEPMEAAARTAVRTEAAARARSRRGLPEARGCLQDAIIAQRLADEVSREAERAQAVALEAQHAADVLAAKAVAARAAAKVAAEMAGLQDGQAASLASAQHSASLSPCSGGDGTGKGATACMSPEPLATDLQRHYTVWQLLAYRHIDSESRPPELCTADLVPVPKGSRLSRSTSQLRTSPAGETDSPGRPVVRPSPSERSRSRGSCHTRSAERVYVAEESRDSNCVGGPSALEADKGGNTPRSSERCTGDAAAVSSTRRGSQEGQSCRVVGACHLLKPAWTRNGRNFLCRTACRRIKWAARSRVQLRSSGPG
eukprot:gnl/TRDRNA2_/TRDRNA2_91765_c0_seq2.p1 gnl/TRDRNA2_/TRDRNA2_91765_c0~~gnl/TRDRNA2_/TRDRNA2_91765_c0_seq2.p1  ORF type:complete len:347 (-),score=42.53 gnl/TRDRNA2_/TRDRNA2_91765_c0_seq2:20-1012(-)